MKLSTGKFHKIAATACFAGEQGIDMGTESHREIQELLVDKILRFLGYIIIPVLLVNLSRYFILGWLFSFNFYIISALILLAVSFNTDKLSYTFKASFLMLTFLTQLSGFAEKLIVLFFTIPSVLIATSMAT